MMHVVATAGHVDHGKSTLVRALTGMEPDRWAEERRRGMTIDLGYAWTTLPSGADIAFVDVPGHERFIGNMLAGLGPVPAVLFVVAADEGWSRQSTEHLTAVDALALRHGLLAVTRSDLADPAPALEEARERLVRSSLGEVEAVAVSGVTGHGLFELREALDRLVAGLTPPDPHARVRLWVDRVFTVRGSGTVVTGTLGSGRLAVGDQLDLDSRGGPGRRVTVRGLQRLHRTATEVEAVSRVAVNLRAVEVADVTRGDALLAPGAWRATTTVDIRLDVRLGGQPARLDSIPAQLVLHVGTAAVPVRVRRLGADADTARLSVARPVPVQAGDRAILRDPGRQAIVAGALVLDADPPPLRRRGAAARRAASLAASSGAPDVIEQVARRGAVRRRDLVALGVLAGPTASAPPGIHDVHGWLVSPDQWRSWQHAVTAAVDARATAEPVDPRMPLEAARRAAGIPELPLLTTLAQAAGLEVSDGRVSRPGVRPRLAAAALAGLEARWAEEPFAAPEHDELLAAGLGPREVAAAVAEGRLLRLRDDVVLQPRAPARAMQVLVSLPQPFTVSEARQALRTSRRVAVPLLEHLDARGWTVRVDARLRRVSGR